VLKYGAPPDNLVVLSVRDEAALWALLQKLNDTRRYAFHEPDLDDQLTAIAAGPECWRKVSSVGLMR
jgi:hypothetical protein